MCRASKRLHRRGATNSSAAPAGPAPAHTAPPPSAPWPTRRRSGPAGRPPAARRPIATTTRSKPVAMPVKSRDRFMMDFCTRSLTARSPRRIRRVRSYHRQPRRRESRGNRQTAGGGMSHRPAWKRTSPAMTSRRLRHLEVAIFGAAFLTASAGLMAPPRRESGAAQQPAGKTDAAPPSPDDQVEALVREYDAVRGALMSRPLTLTPSRRIARRSVSRDRRRTGNCIKTSPGDSSRWRNAIRERTRPSRR